VSETGLSLKLILLKRSYSNLIVVNQIMDKKMKRYTAPKNHFEALQLALSLAVNAPTQKQSEEMISEAAYFAEFCSELEIERAKKNVENE
jgi:flagellar biosynthesis protein FliP